MERIAVRIRVGVRDAANLNVVFIKPSSEWPVCGISSHPVITKYYQEIPALTFMRS